MQQTIITQLETALNETIYLLKGFDGDNLNKIPFEGSWTAAQVGRHIYKSAFGSNDMFAAPGEQANRPADENAEGLRATFMNFDTKMKSPEYIIPEDITYSQGQLIDSLTEVKNKMLNAINSTDLGQIAQLPQGNPFVGSTKLEIVHFYTYHTLRHNHQIEKIKAIVVN
jgi:hypothetical protein